MGFAAQLTCLWLFAQAPSGGTPAPAPPPPAPEQLPPNPTVYSYRQATVKLLSPGAEPRTKLRPDVPPDAGVQSVDLTFDLTNRTESPDGTSSSTPPPMLMPFTVVSTGEGIGALFGRTNVVGGQAAIADAGMDLTLAQTLIALTGVRIAAVLDSRGSVVTMLRAPGTMDELFHKNPRQFTPESGMAMELAQEIVARMAIPMPVEAVGVGARWEVTRTVDSGLLTYVETAQIELTKVSKQKLELSLTFVGRPATFGPFMGSDSISVRGGGRASVDLRRLMPTSYQDKLEVKTKSGKKSVQTTLGLKAVSR